MRTETDSFCSYYIPEVLKMNHLVDVLAKLANFIRDRGLNH